MSNWVKFRAKIPGTQTDYSIEGRGDLISLEKEMKAAAEVGFTEVVKMEVICKD